MYFSTSRAPPADAGLMVDAGAPVRRSHDGCKRAEYRTNTSRLKTQSVLLDTAAMALRSHHNKRQTVVVAALTHFSAAAG